MTMEEIAAERQEQIDAFDTADMALTMMFG